jgi:hypothetical protein
MKTYAHYFAHFDCNWQKIYQSQNVSDKVEEKNKNIFYVQYTYLQALTFFEVDKQKRLFTV